MQLYVHNLIIKWQFFLSALFGSYFPCYKHTAAVFRNFCNSNISCFFVGYIKPTLHRTISWDLVSFSSAFCSQDRGQIEFFCRSKSCSESRGSFHVSPRRGKEKERARQRKRKKRLLCQVRQVARKLPTRKTTKKTLRRKCCHDSVTSVLFFRSVNCSLFRSTCSTSSKVFTLMNINSYYFNLNKYFFLF